ncbi:Holliday junction branch migration protein RuvA [Desulfobotulus sp.]|jgi:Holliday junction DNA helicase RuvA|uniref:Holliday junction branch migration protein RuvA n=1 Tax=Desulfobotulus sp. TaxID=1940337 RepID=UPI002A366023|nr:Holliday junction branch migration protein RuvA [Desulfobotulus sp.]MDY0163743.1 Holliday junction branch migration protein RuvA [Desulfobotulus sp.]
MIAYLEGSLFKKEEDRILLLVHHVGYEVLLPTVVMDALGERETGSPLALHIYYYQTERQPRPILIGFHREREKNFFQLFLTVEDIGPIKAAKALTMPVEKIAQWIESGDVAGLSGLKGIGRRTAQKIVATLGGKAGQFLDMPMEDQKRPQGTSPLQQNMVGLVRDVLVQQMGHKLAEAEKLIQAALARNPDIHTPEVLLEEIYRSWRPGGVHDG